MVGLRVLARSTDTVRNVGDTRRRLAEPVVGRLRVRPGLGQLSAQLQGTLAGIDVLVLRLAWPPRRVLLAPELVHMAAA